MSRIAMSRPGQRLIYAVKEAIRASQGLTLVDVPSRPRIVLGFSSIRLGAENEPTGTVAAIVVIFASPDMPLNGYFLNGWAKSCPAEQVAVCAQEILAMVDRQLDDLRRSDPSLWKQL